MLDTSRSDDRIAAKFRNLQTRREGALVAYLTGGDPNREAFLSNCIALINGGADIVEIGIPFSDPIADGPVIQASSMRALSQGTTPSGILDMVGELSSEFQIPFVVLTYYNPIWAMGLERFLKRAHENGVDGIVVPDLPLEEADRFRETTMKHGIDNIYLAAPNTSKARLKSIVDKSKGFLYLVSLYGVTGSRDTLSPQALNAIRRVQSLAKGKLPVSVGFGISKPEHVSAIIRSGADGAIVGSALVRIVGAHLDDPGEAVNQLSDLVRALKTATRR